MTNPTHDGSGSPLGLLQSAPRVASVVGILRRHGFGDVLSGSRSWPEPEQVRDALGELGLVFVKFGQVLSTRGDLLPEPYIAALESLQDHVTPVPVDTVREVVIEELGAAPEELFAVFDPEPLASASVAQVHAATLEDGRDVVVKVQRPGLEGVVREDLRVLAHLAGFFDLTSARLRPYDLPSLVRDFRHNLEAELDFHREASNIRRFEGVLADEERLWIPAPIPEFSGRRVLTMERSHGVRLDRFVAEHPEDASELARRIGRLFIRQIFSHGLFHADPHPGNFFVLEGGRLCLHDFGMVGEVDETMREALVDLVDATVSGDARGATQAYLDLGLLPRDVDRESLQIEVGKLVAEIRGKPLNEVSVGEALQSLARVGGRYRIRNPGAIMLLSRVFITLEGVLARLDPGLGFVELFGDAFRDALGRRFSPDRLRRDAFVALRGVDKLARQAPDDVRRVLERWGEGSIGQVTVALDAGEARRRSRESQSLRQTSVAGFLTIAGSVLMAGTEGRTQVIGGVMTAVGSALLVLRFFRG